MLRASKRRERCWTRYRAHQNPCSCIASTGRIAPAPSLRFIASHTIAGRRTQRSRKHEIMEWHGMSSPCAGLSASGTSANARTLAYLRRKRPPLKRRRSNNLLRSRAQGYADLGLALILEAGVAPGGVDPDEKANLERPAAQRTHDPRGNRER